MLSARGRLCIAWLLETRQHSMSSLGWAAARQRSGHGRFLRLTADAPAPTGRSRGGRGSAYFPNLPARPPRRVRAGPGG